MKKVLEALALILAATMCAGCLGASALDQYGYAVIAGVDAGEQLRYKVTLMLQQDEQSSSDQTTTGGAMVVTAEGDTIMEVLAILDGCLPFELNLSRLNLMVFSDEVAKSGEMEQFLSFSRNNLRIRQSVKLAVAIESAEDFIKGLETGGELNLTKLQYSYMQNFTGEGMTTSINQARALQGIRSGTFDPVLTLGRVDRSATAAEGGEEQSEQYTTVGIYRSGGIQSYTYGVAIFDEWSMVGALSAEDTMLLLMTLGVFEEGHMSYAGEDEELVLLLRSNGGPKVDIQLGDVCHADITVPLRCEIQQDGQNSAKLRWDEGVCEELSRYIESELTRVYNTCRELNSDAMGLGRYAAMCFNDTAQWESFDWKRHYMAATATFTVELDVMDMSMAEYME